MKRIISFLLAAVITAGCFCISSSAQATAGDMTGDGIVNSQDALDILMITVGQKESSAELLEIGDIDRSGDFSSVDALFVLMYSIGEKIAVQGISADKTEVTAKPGDTFTVSAYVFPILAENLNVQFASSDEKVASVDKNGKVTVKGGGKCDIICSSQENSSIAKTVKVTSSDVKIKKFTLDNAPERISQGSTFQLKYTITPSDATNKKITWKSSDTSLATIDENGKIKAKVIGTFTVTGTTTDGSNIKVQCTIKIRAMKIPYVNQMPNYPTGCEAASSCMLLQYYGFKINIDQMVNIIPRKNTYIKNGKRYGPDINEMFVGDPRYSYTSKNPGYGAFSPCVTKALQTAIDQRGGGYTAKKISGCTFNELLSYVSEGYPVMVWATYKMQQPTKVNSWYIETTGKYFEYPRGTHVMILSGYDGTKVATVDPYNGNGVLEFSKSVFKSRWELLGRQGIILVKN